MSSPGPTEPPIAVDAFTTISRNFEIISNLPLTAIMHQAPADKEQENDAVNIQKEVAEIKEYINNIRPIIMFMTNSQRRVSDVLVGLGATELPGPLNTREAIFKAKVTQLDALAAQLEIPNYATAARDRESKIGLIAAFLGMGI